MPRYRLAKAAEHALNLEWLRTQLTDLRKQALPHQVMLDRLDARLAQEAAILRQLEIAVVTGGMEIYADVLTERLARSFGAMAEHYLAGLMHQTARELRWRETLLAEIRRLRLDWIQDLLVRLSRELAVVTALRNDSSIPVLFAPPNQQETFFSLPGLYHEFAHCVERFYPHIIARLQQVVAEHFTAEKAKVGPLPPRVLKQTLLELDEAASFWDQTRLAEIFCDVFAGYVCGPANILSMIDLARTQGGPQTSTDLSYPPYAARVEACFAALEAAQQQDPLAGEAIAQWRAVVARETPGNFYWRCCPPELMAKLATACNQEIAACQPNTPRHTALLPSLADARVAVPGDQLREVIAAGMVILWKAPNEFQGWKATVLPAAGLI
jgi:hypothetical protein